MTNLEQRKPYTLRQVWDALISRTLYNKLAAPSVTRGEPFYVNVRDLAQFVDREAFDNSKYAKYWIINKMQRALEDLGDQGWIMRDHERIAIHQSLTEFIASKPREVIDAYISEHMKERDG